MAIRISGSQSDATVLSNFDGGSGGVAGCAWPARSAIAAATA
jgi:hypothetical protein